MKRNDDLPDGMSNLIVFLILAFLFLLLAIWVENKPAVFGPKEPAQTRLVRSDGEPPKSTK